MSLAIQVVIDAHDPRSLGAFWAVALGYVEEPPPAGFADWDAALDAWGYPPERRNSAYAVIDPTGTGPRVFFQQVPEDKIVKNRVHLDLRAAAAAGADPTDREASKAARWAHARRLVDLGGRVLTEVDDPRDGAWIVMADPEGNEFCVA